MILSYSPIESVALFAICRRQNNINKIARDEFTKLPTFMLSAHTSCCLESLSSVWAQQQLTNRSLCVLETDRCRSLQPEIDRSVSS